MGISVNELRIGNFVRFSDFSNIFSITEISPTGLGVEDKNESTWIELETFEPIPLTEEWLEKLGFNRIGDNFELNGIGIWFNVITEKYVFRYWAKGFIYIESVHQLQNLFFSLCKMELTLNK